MRTEVIGGATPNQDSAAGAVTDHGWHRWNVLVGLVVCFVAFFGLAAGLYVTLGQHQWTEAELNETFVGSPMGVVTRQFGPAEQSAANPTDGQLERLDYRGAVKVRDKPTGTLVTFYGENGRCVRVAVP